MSKPDDQTIAAWAMLLRAHRTAFEGVEAALKAAGLPPLAWYDALLELRKARGPLRLQALEARLLLPQYNISRIADRLADAGYAEKSVDPADGRGRMLAITRQGRGVLKRMWPVYAGAIEAHMGAHLTPAEAARLAALLTRIAGA